MSDETTKPAPLTAQQLRDRLQAKIDKVQRLIHSDVIVDVEDIRKKVLRARECLNDIAQSKDNAFETMAEQFLQFAEAQIDDLKANIAKVRAAIKAVRQVDAAPKE